MPLTVLTKISVTDVWQGLEYVFGCGPSDKSKDAQQLIYQRTSFEWNIDQVFLLLMISLHSIIKFH